MKHETWIVVADGAEARIMGDDRPTPDILSDLADAHPLAREGVTDRYRVARDAAIYEADPHRERKRKLMREVADAINAAADNNEFQKLIVVAPPGELGDFRSALDPQAAERVVCELTRDLTHLQSAEVCELLQAQLR